MNDVEREATVETRRRSRTIQACLFVLAAGACARPHPGASASGAAPVASASEPERAPARDAATEREIEAKISQGRAELALGHAALAQQDFEAAAALDGGSPRTRVWVIRSWLPQGRINDALDAADALEREGAKGPALDYLFGMSFSAKARDYQAKDVSNQIAAMSFADATAFLERATTADPELYADAFAPLAEAAWSMQKLELASAAAARARALDPESAELALLAGRIALAGHAAAAADPARSRNAVASANDIAAIWFETSFAW